MARIDYSPRKLKIFTPKGRRFRKRFPNFKTYIRYGMHLKNKHFLNIFENEERKPL